MDPARLLEPLFRPQGSASRSSPAARRMPALFRGSFRFVAAAGELPPPLPGSVVLFGTASPETAGRDHAAALRGMAAEGRVSRRAARAAGRVRREPAG